MIMNNVQPSRKVYYVLRIASAMCFIGHGTFGIIGKTIWCNYFAVFGIGTDLSYQLMPFVGASDILFGIILLVYPMRIVLLWLVVWGFITALLRPLSGEPFAEFLERAGNYGTPFALLILSGFPKNIRQAFLPVTPVGELNPTTYTQLFNCLRVVVFLLLAGHGWLNLTEKQDTVNQFASLGLANPASVVQLLGLVEVVSAFIILIKPFRQIVLILFIWKMASETLYPHYPAFEWIERGGSYGSLLALWYLTGTRFSLRTFSLTNLLIKPKGN